MREKLQGIAGEGEPAQEKLLVGVAFSFRYSLGDFKVVAIDDSGVGIYSERSRGPLDADGDVESGLSFVGTSDQVLDD